MTGDKFDKCTNRILCLCKTILSSKSKEYATEDRLHNFKAAALLQKTSPRKALAGMMVQHTVSVYDMCREDKIYPPEMWDEKIVDSINYLLLLRALVEGDRVKE